MVSIAIGAVLVGLFLLAYWRPWVGLLLLLSLLPFNGFLVDIVTPSLHFSSTASTMAAGWHDALAGGVIVAAGIRWLRARSFRPNAVEAVAVVVLASGAASLAITPHLETGLYAFRVAFEPICLALAIAVLARTSGLAPNLASRAAQAMFVSGLLASLFAVWQVYGGGFSYLTTFFKTSDGRLPAAYLASFILQPRAIGTFNSPNEFAAFLVIVLVLAATPGLLLIKSSLAAWACAVIGFVILLSFSRSSWVSLTVATAMLLLMLPVTRARIGAVMMRIRSRAWLRTYVPPLALFLVLVGAVAGTSGVSDFVSGTLTGRDPSAASHASSLSSLLNGTGVTGDGNGVGLTPAARIAPFGIGMGMAGAKSARFGQVSADNVLSSETWYVNYLLQAGYVGLLALLALVAVVARTLWRKRRIPEARAALAAAAGLAVGALFIPVIDEPAVAIPLWALIGLGLGSTATATTAAAASESPSEAGAA